MEVFILHPSALIPAFQRGRVSSTVGRRFVSEPEAVFSCPFGRGRVRVLDEVEISDWIIESADNVRSVPSAVADGFKSQLANFCDDSFCRPLRGL